MKLIVNPEIFTKVKDLNVGVIVIKDADNTVDIGAFVKDEYAVIAKSVRVKFDGADIAEYPVIKKWREIYKGFGEKKVRSSIESLIRRVTNGKDIYNINPLVDIYNLASLKFELPCGGEDTDVISADLELTFADGSENFIPLGETETENPNAGEIIYKFADTAVCRNFNYRESDVTKLTENTKNAVIVFEEISAGASNLKPALDWLAAKVTELLSAKIVTAAILNESCNYVEW